MLNSITSSTCTDNMVNFGPLAAEISFTSLGHPCKFQRVSRLGSVTARRSSSWRQPNFAALNRGCHLYSAGRPSRWALANISSFHSFSVVCVNMLCPYCDVVIANCITGTTSGNVNDMLTSDRCTVSVTFGTVPHM